MANYKLNVTRMDEVLKKAIEAIDNSKSEIFDIAESARKECNKLEQELEMLKKQVKELIESVEVLEVELKDSKKKLMYVSKNHDKFSEDELRQAYEKADNLRVELAIRREQEQFHIKRRNELEVRIKDAYKIVQKADNLMTHVGVALNYLTGDLQQVSLHLEDMHERQLMGIRILKAQEDERQRVAREIHDGPAQSMSNVVLKAEICERLIDVDGGKTKQELGNLKKIVRESLQDVRKIIYDLRPMSLDDLGLVPTLQRYITTYKESTNINVSFKTIGINDYNIKSIISLTLFRIVQEGLNNIKKHAGAQNVAVNLEFMKEKIKLYVYDDGKGFDVEALKAKNEGNDQDISGGFGLFSMKERVDLLDGEFKIQSELGKGTRLNITIPILQEEGG